MFVPHVDGNIGKYMMHMPEEISQASGLRIFGKLTKSFVFTTDIAMIRNINADAVVSVYPFTPQPVIAHAIITASNLPVFCGVGGGSVSGAGIVEVAKDAEFSGAAGIVVNAPTSNDTIRLLKENLDIPILLTVTSTKSDIDERVAAGVDIFNVSAAAETPAVVRYIRDKYPEFPIIATGGPSADTILQTISAGANGITYTPPSTADVFRDMMNKYRQLF